MSVSELIDYLEIEEDLERTRKCVRVLLGTFNNNLLTTHR